MDKPSIVTPNASAHGHGISAHDQGEIVTPLAANFTPRRQRFNIVVPPMLQKLTAFGSLSAYFTAMVAVSWVFLMGRNLPDTTRLWDRTRPVSVQFVDRQGRDLMTRGAQEASPVSVETLPPHLVEAILSIEDRRFYEHVGIDPYSLARALVKNLKNRGYSEGASTLTQQLAKNVFLQSDKTIARKTKEAILALWLERDFTKDELLEMYLERVYFGAGTWGIDAAARSYFGKPVTDLNVSESALLVGLLKAPSRYNPRANSEAAGARTARVLRAMKDVGYLNRWEYYSALSEPLHFRPFETDEIGEYFVEWIWPQIEEKIGTPTTDLVITTTLDSEAQKIAEAALVTYLDSDAAEDRKVSQGALVSLDGSGDVLAMVGGRSFEDSPFNRAVQAKRQPGSAFKPFVYLTAFETGISPWDIRLDAPYTIATRQGDWTPRNFSKTFKGPMRLETALAKSINTVTAELGAEVGLSRVTARAEALGLVGLAAHPSVTLGTEEVTPLALTQSYQPFASYGYQAPAAGLRTISTSDGRILYDRHLAGDAPAPVRKIDQQNLGLINRAMKQVVDSGTGRAARIRGRDVAGKTGTTNDYRDAWFVGYVPDMVTTVWLGNDDNSPMDRMTGGAAPARIWKSYMEQVLDGVPNARLSIASEPILQSKDERLDILLSDIENALPN
ncbi:MAG: PBP1A family penicillin-binding protein [Maricaulaceae bacterium]